MRPALISLLTSAVAVVSATGCAQDNIDELAARTTCGNRKTIAKCLRAAVDLARLEDVEWCYVAGGCEVADATAEALWFTQDCRAFEVQEAEKELKRRQDSTADATTTHTTTKASTTKTSKTTARSTTASVASTSATTTQESTTTSASVASTSDSTASSTTSTSIDSTTASTGTAASATTTGDLVCSVTSTVSTTACSVSGGKTISCYPTSTAIASCAPGLICFAAATAGARALCMKRDDSLTTSGLVVTIAFAVGILFTIICFVVSALRSKSKAKKDASDRLLAAASSGRRKDVEAANEFSGGRNAGGSEANLPLMTPGGQRSETYAAGQQDYFAQGQQGAPRLNPGLGALQHQEARY